jgi:hypothetical protein
VSGPRQRLSGRERLVVAISVGVFVIVALAISVLPRSTPVWAYLALAGGALALAALGVAISRRR